MASSGLREMTTDYQSITVLVASQESTAGTTRLGFVVIERTLFVRNRHLHRVMHDVAGDYGNLPLGFDVNADVAGSVARRGKQSNLRAHLKICVDQVCQTGFHDG
ncbi:hypothetical protein D3C84_669170 [compost metagenome]